METGSGTFTPPMSPRVESPRAAAAVGEERQGSGKGIQMQIQQLANEQERIQKKTFTNWMNTYLKQKNMKVENLFEDIKDGVYLLSLLEALSGEKLQMERGKLKRVHHVSNISTALKFLEMKKIKLVNINVLDIADGKPSIVLGLTWTIILSFQIVDTFAQQEHDPDKPLSALEKFRMNAKKALLAWTGNAITKKYGIKISDFGKSWRDGLAFNAIVHTIRPDLIDFENVRNQSARANLEQAFSTAEDHLGIARLLDPEDVDVEKPDEKSIMTYVAQFLKAYPEAGEDPALGRRSKDPATQEMNEYTDLMTWLSAEAEEVLQIVDQPVTDRQQEYMDYLAFKAELDRREAVYKKLEEKCLAKKALKITEPMWTELNTKWRSAARRTRMWLWKLDASLPGKLGKFGDWLNQGEEVLEQQPEDVQDRNDLAQKLAKLLQESAEYFKDAESWKTFFYEVKRAGKYEGEFLIQPQIDSLANRLTALLKEYPRREKRLAFEEYQQKVQALRESAEAKLQVWTEKLGQQEDVELMLEDYNDFVNTQQLFHTYNSLSTNLSKKADVWKKSAGKEREQEVKKFIEEENTQWKKVSEDIKTVLPNLEKGLENWKLYNNGIETLTSFINEGESVMSRSAEEKQQHFSETPENEEKLRQVNDSGYFLMEVCSESIADEIRQTLASLNTEFKTVTESFEEFKRVEIIGKGKQEYAEGVNRISEWLKNAEELMLQPVPCIHANLKDHLQDLTMCSSQIPEMENDFKSTTKTAQSLVKDSSPDVVSEMLQTLNVQKEVIVRLREEIPERIKYLKAMLPNVESLETGISDLGIWLDKGDTVLSANKTYCKCMPVHFSKENRHDHACTSRSDCACGVQMMESRNEAQHFVGCDLCQQPVSFFCRRCGVNLCDPCVTIHLRVKSTNVHEIVDFASKDDDDTCHCDSHPQNDCSAYCKTCDAPICILCVSIKHKSHEMSELSDKIEELLKLIAKENDRLQSSKHELERILDHTTKMLSSISLYYKQRKDEVTARGEEWHKLIEETVKKLHQELDDMQKEHEALLLQQKKEFEEMIGKVDEMNGKAVKLKKSKNVKEMQTFVPVIQNLKNLNEVSQYSFPTFNECKLDSNYLKSNFGYVEKMQEKKTTLLENEFKESELSSRGILEVPTVTSVIDTGFPASEKNNRLYDMAVTDDNKVWMGGESTELKLFDLQGHLHHTVSITARGMFLCMYNKQVVYSDQPNKAVRMISGTDTVVTMFTTGDWKPYGVTSAASGDLLVCLRKDDQYKVVRYSSAGTVLQEIQYDSQCQPLYTRAMYITENVNGDIIVTDWEKKAVITVDRLGIFQYSYSNKDNKFKPSSVATDSVGHVIVTDGFGKKIHMLDRDGQFLRYIIPEGGITRPRGVCILGHGEMMVGEVLIGIAKKIKYLEE